MSRQAFYSYLNGTALPRQRTLQKAVSAWGIKISVGTESFDLSSFPVPKAEEKAEPVAQQLSLDLWQVLDRITQEDLAFGVKRVGKTLRLDMRIKIPA